MKNYTFSNYIFDKIKADVISYKALFDNSKDGIFLLKQGRLIDFNPAVLTMFKCTRSEIINKTPFYFSPQKQPDGEKSSTKAKRMIQIALEKQHHSFEWIHRKLDGTNFPCIINLAKVNIEGENFVQAIVHDITNLKKAYNELEKNEKRYRNILENLAYSIIRINAKGRFQYVNSGFSVSLDYSVRNIIGKNIFEFVADIKNSELIVNFEKVIRKHPSSLYQEIAFVNAKGKVIWFGFDLKFNYTNKKLDFIQGEGKDITDKRNKINFESAMYKLSKAIITTKHLSDLYKAVHKIVAELMPAKNFFIALYDAENDMISFPYFIDQYNEPPKPQKPKKTLTGYVIKTNKPLLATNEKLVDMAKNGEIGLYGERSVDWLGVPLKSRNATIGVLVVQSYDQKIRYDTSSIEALEFVSTQIALAIERKRSSEKLENSYSLLSTAIESTKDGILVVDNLGRIKLFNNNFKKIFEIPDETITLDNHGQLIKYLLIKLKNPKAFIKNLNYLDENPGESINDIVKFKDGRIFEGYSIPLIIKDKVEGRVWSFKDTTQQKNAEAALKEEQKLLYSLMDNIPDSIYFKDKDSRFLKINKAQAKILGVEHPNDAIGKQDYNFFDHELAKEIYEDEQKIIKSKIPIIAKEEKIIKENGKETWFSVTKVPIINDKGDVTGIVGVSRDITDRKEAEKNIKKYSEKLKALNSSKDKFFSIIAHDLKSPFSALLGFLEMLIKDVDSLSKTEIKEYLIDTNKSAKNIFSLIENLLSWTQIQRGKIPCEPRNLNLRKICHKAIVPLQMRADQKTITIKNNIAEDIEVFADKFMTETIFRNLINNAIKFSYSKGEITISALIKSDHVLVEVKDIGVGIDEDKLQNLFKIEQQQSTLGTFNEKGTGLGLILVKEMVEENKGIIWVNSQINKGSTFYFTLPKINIDKSQGIT